MKMRNTLSDCYVIVHVENVHLLEFAAQKDSLAKDVSNGTWLVVTQPIQRKHCGQKVCTMQDYQLESFHNPFLFNNQ
jgi:hypothetical protein